MTALQIFANPSEQSAFLAQQSAHIRPRVPAETASAAASAARAVQERGVSLTHNFDDHVRWSYFVRQQFGISKLQYC